MNFSSKKNTIQQTREDRTFDAIAYVVITILVLACLYPVWYVLCASLTKPSIVAGAGGVLFWPQEVTLDAYRRVFSNIEIWSGLFNTLLYTIVGTFLNLALTCMLAYALSRKKLMFKKPLTLFVTFTMFFGAGMIPTYIIVRDLGLLDHRVAAILPGMVSVFNFIVVRTHFESLPDALEESAKLDGANHWMIFTRIILPVSGATLAVLTLFYGVSHWNSWFNEMLYLPNVREAWPLALITREIVLSSSNAAMSDGATMTQEMADSIKYATIIVTTFPMLCLYPFLQKYFAKGVMVGAVKG